MALPLAAIPLIASGLQAGIGAVQGISGARKRRKTIRPEYAMPEEIRKNVMEAETAATYGLEGESKRLATEGMDRATASALYGAGTRKSGLAGMGAIVQSQSDAAKNLAEIDQIERARKKAIASQARSEMAAYKDKEFELNKMQPYQMAMDESQALIGAGLQNVMGGINTAAMTGIYGGTGTEKMGGANMSAEPTVDPTMKNWTTEQQQWYMNLTPEQKRFLTLTGKTLR